MSRWNPLILTQPQAAKVFSWTLNIGGANFEHFGNISISQSVSGMGTSGVVMAAMQVTTWSNHYLANDIAPNSEVILSCSPPLLSVSPLHHFHKQKHRKENRRANEIIREELKDKKVFQWELAHELGFSEQTMVRKMRFEMDTLEQSEMLEAIEEIALRKTEG